MELKLVWIIALRELHEIFRSKWLVACSVGFVLLSLALSRLSLASAGYAGLGGFGRTAASLVNALLLFVPLLGLTIGAGALAGDRERGSLLYLLTQPVSRGEVFWGKALGASLGAFAALAAGFGVTAIALGAAGSGNAAAFGGLVIFTMLLLFASLGMGFVISALARKASASTGAALLLWLGLAFLGDLALLGTVLVYRPTPATLLALLLINPLQLFKLGAIYSLRATLDSLGAAGQFALYRFGETLPFVLGALLLIWIVITFAGALFLFQNQKDL